MGKWQAELAKLLPCKAFCHNPGIVSPPGLAELTQQELHLSVLPRKRYRRETKEGSTPPALRVCAVEANFRSWGLWPQPLCQAAPRTAKEGMNIRP